MDSEDPRILRHGSPQDVSKTKLYFKSGHILFGKRNWYLRRLAVAERDGICSAHMLVLEPIEGKIISEFLPLLMFSDEFYEKALMVSAGSMSPTIKWKDIAKLDFLIPTIPEQQSILSLIHNIDDAISKTYDLLEKTKIYLNSKRESLLTRGVGHTKFKKMSGPFEKNIEIPNEWGFKKLDSLCTLITDGTHYSPKTTMDGHYFATVENIKNSEIDINSCSKISTEDYDKIVKNNCNPKKHDILFTKDGTVGISFVFQQEIDIGLLSSIAIIRTNDSLDPFFCNYSLQSEFLKKHLKTFVGGTALKRIILKDIKSYQLPLPPLLEQKQIVAILVKIDEEIKKLENHLTKLKTMKKSIINSKLTLKENRHDIN